MPRHVVFIHGMYMNARSWEPWFPIAERHGFTPLTVSWPFHDGDPVVRRRTIDPALGSLTFGAVIEHLAARIDESGERPVLVGHSVGGLAVQKLLENGYGKAGVAISPAPPQGVLTASPAFLRANFPHVNPFAGNRPIRMTAERFHYAFGNTMSREASDAAFERWVVPESRNVPRSLLTRHARIDPRLPHPPILMLVGDADHLTPADLVRRNARRYADPVEVREFRGRSHLICNQDGWEEVAETAFGYLATGN